MLKHLGARERSNNTAPVPFAGISLSSQQAAMVNGVAAHVLDYDDVALSAHPSTVLMPAILAESEHEVWLSGAMQDARVTLKSYPEELMVAWKVSRRVNSPKLPDDASLIEPL